MEQAQQNRRAVLIVEDDAELRRFTARLLEDGELDTIECEIAEATLATMLIRGREVAMDLCGYPASRRYGWDRLEIGRAHV